MYVLWILLHVKKFDFPYVSSWAFCKCFPFHSKEDKKKTFVYLPLAVIFVVELVVSFFFSCLGCLKKKMDF